MWLDFGAAGTFFSQQLTLFGEVIGCDPRPFHVHGVVREWPLRSRGFENIVVVSTLEHHLDIPFLLQDLLTRLTSTGQILITVPTGSARLFRGYRNISPEEIQTIWPGRKAVDYFFKRQGGDWVRVSALISHLRQPINTEHTVKLIACVRLTSPSTDDLSNPAPGWPEGGSIDPAHGSVGGRSVGAPTDRMGTGSGLTSQWSAP